MDEAEEQLEVVTIAQVRDPSGDAVRRAWTADDPGAPRADPFLLLEHTGPSTFGPASAPRTDGATVFKGLQALTLVYSGDLSQRSSNGGAAELGPGDALWTTAGTGVVGRQRRGPKLTREGGVLEAVRLWVNLPVAHKHVDPQARILRASEFPVIPLSQVGANYVRLVAGRWEAYTGPAKSFSPLTIADIYLDAGSNASLSLAPSWNTFVYVLSGRVDVEGEAAAAGSLVRLSGRDSVRLSAAALRNERDGAVHVLLLSGEPLSEPVVREGGIALNTEDGLRQAKLEARTGRYGTLT